MTQDITSLIEKLEGAEVGSVELDALIYSHLNCTLIPRRADYRPRRRWPDGLVTLQRKVTTSLDAALALALRIMSEDEVLFWLNQVVYRADQDTVNGTVKGLPLKLCAAILRAQSEAR